MVALRLPLQWFVVVILTQSFTTLKHCRIIIYCRSFHILLKRDPTRVSKEPCMGLVVLVVAQVVVHFQDVVPRTHLPEGVGLTLFRDVLGLESYVVSIEVVC